MTTALKPPFSLATALEKVQRAEDLWNSKDAQRVSLAYGNEHWEFDDEGLMHTRDASINEQAIDESQRRVF